MDALKKMRYMLKHPDREPGVGAMLDIVNTDSNGLVDSRDIPLRAYLPNLHGTP